MTESLDPALRRLFFAQHTADQRHAFEVAQRVADQPELVEAALLHDVGKIDAGIGPVQRSLATLWLYTTLPVWGRWQRYLGHGPRGADVLEDAGASELTVAFTRHHPGDAPAGVDKDAWILLEGADDA